MGTPLSMLLDRVAGISEPIEALSVLGHGSLEVMGVDGVGVVAMSGDARRTPVFTSNDRASLVERLQFGGGAGPCLDAYESGHPIEAGHLAADERWPTLSPSMVEAGVAAIFAFPLVANGDPVGTADFHRRTPGDLETGQVADGFEISKAMATLLLASVDELDEGVAPFGWEQSSHLRHVVHQASGMVSVQAGISVDQALARMRALAWTDGRTLDELAADVVARRLRFDP